jgi:hypothetical protein
VGELWALCLYSSIIIPLLHLTDCSKWYWERKKKKLEAYVKERKKAHSGGYRKKTHNGRKDHSGWLPGRKLWIHVI